MFEVKSAEIFYEALDREMANNIETVNQHCREMPAIREAVVEKDAQICSIMDPKLMFMLERLSHRNRELREAREEVERVVESERTEVEEWKKKEGMDTVGDNQ